MYTIKIDTYDHDNVVSHEQINYKSSCRRTLADVIVVSIRISKHEGVVRCFQKPVFLPFESLCLFKDQHHHHQVVHNSELQPNPSQIVSEGLGLFVPLVVARQASRQILIRFHHRVFEQATRMVSQSCSYSLLRYRSTEVKK